MMKKYHILYKKNIYFLIWSLCQFSMVNIICIDRILPRETSNQIEAHKISCQATDLLIHPHITFYIWITNWWYNHLVTFDYSHVSSLERKRVLLFDFLSQSCAIFVWFVEEFSLNVSASLTLIPIFFLSTCFSRSLFSPSFHPPQLDIYLFLFSL